MIIYNEYKNNDENSSNKEQNVEVEKAKDEKIKEMGQITLDNNENNYKIHLLNIIGEVEGHQELPPQNKATKYEHIIPQLVTIREDKDADGLLVVINTLGGDVEAGLAIAEMISSLGKPVVSLVLGGGHSIGVPLAVASDYSYISPSASMTVHPIRMNGTIIGVPQTYEYFDKMQDRIIEFVASNSGISRKRYKELMMATGNLAKDIGTVLVGEEAVKEKIINEVGGLDQALEKIYYLIGEKRKQK